MEYTEILKLKKSLEDLKIPFDFRSLAGGYQIRYPSSEETVCSVIEHDSSYGREKDLLEIMGLLTKEEENDDYGGPYSVKGYLPAEEVLRRIREHYEGGASEKSV